MRSIFYPSVSQYIDIATAVDIDIHIDIDFFFFEMESHSVSRLEYSGSI